MQGIHLLGAFFGSQTFPEPRIFLVASTHKLIDIKLHPSNPPTRKPDPADENVSYAPDSGCPPIDDSAGCTAVAAISSRRYLAYAAAVAAAYGCHLLFLWELV